MPTRLLPLPAVASAVALALTPAAYAPGSPADSAPPPRPKPLPFNIEDWTPRPAVGKAEPWERATDKDWVDARFRQMDTGPVLNCTMRYPLGKEQPAVYKAAVVRLGAKGDAGAVFDRATMKLTAAWTGGYLNHADRRFGLMNTPTPKGEVVFAAPRGPGWADPDGKWDAPGRLTAPLPAKWARYRGHYLHGDRVVFSYTVRGREVLEAVELTATADGKPALVHVTSVRAGGTPVEQAPVARGTESLVYPEGPQRAIVSRSLTPAAGRPAEDPDPLTKGGPRRWGDPIVTKLERGPETGPFAVDTLTIPYQNRFNALFFCTGVDFLPGGRVAVCTAHGDVWVVTVDETAGTCAWQRLATGLYHPLGLKVVDGKVVVLERGQLTRLHDLNADGEADFYECLCNDWDTGPGEHSFDTCLETDPDGNFYFFKTGDTDLPTGGCLMKVSKDGAKAEVFATGFRHPIGMGMSPTGILTGADQEGNWMPATRLDQYKKGGFYGDMRAHHRADPPKTYDPPVCWLPREVDNSAGGDVWVPEKAWGPLAGLPLHLSYGRCRPYVLLRQECDGGLVQGGVAGLDITFLAGSCRGRFGPDGHLYVCGLNGWQTAARADGSLQRVRYTGKPLDTVVKMVVDGDALRLTFSRPLDPKAVADAAGYKAAWWNYRWEAAYGSKRWKVSDPNAEGQDEFGPRSAELLADGRTVELRFEKLRPVMQMQVGYNVAAAGGAKVTGSVFLTIHTTGK
ncbi:MAG: hypothetical protein C0501_18180 [Isosphaera sp.]|nr:hypothetical protein [Isosphaera sp.]